MQHKHKKQPKDVKTRAIHRIKIIRGHLKKIEDMLENDAYCVDIVHQSRAVQSALRKLDDLIVEEHLNTCVVDQIRNGEESTTTKELLTLFEYKH